MDTEWVEMFALFMKRRLKESRPGGEDAQPAPEPAKPAAPPAAVVPKPAAAAATVAAAAIAAAATTAAAAAGFAPREGVPDPPHGEDEAPAAAPPRGPAGTTAPGPGQR